jgi:hypothetical protein
MYLRSVKDKRLDVPGDITILPGIAAPPERPLKIPPEQLHALLANKAKPKALPTDILTPRTGKSARLVPVPIAPRRYPCAAGVLLDPTTL